MSTLHAYDPEIQPNAKDWLELDEHERILLVEQFHRKAKIKLPNANLHAIFHVIVENQLAMGLESVVRAIPRLIQQGLTRHDAVHAIASVLTEHLHVQAKAETQDTGDVAQARYDSAVERLTAKDWISRYGGQ